MAASKSELRLTRWCALPVPGNTPCDALSSRMQTPTILLTLELKSERQEAFGRLRMRMLSSTALLSPLVPLSPAQDVLQRTFCLSCTSITTARPCVIGELFTGRKNGVAFLLILKCHQTYVHLLQCCKSCKVCFLATGKHFFLGI